ncbi:uncharacterized protein LOC123520457 [Portunus trituberculatus]|uniref:uncharacterized protein LOC123520457 n=1 Tax=Portunus trituberculatus TaxID=210409 RepID=UPI001E1CD80B|nr:uncharacterized protein LOC123520457 [Portunus trituberculatus]
MYRPCRTVSLVWAWVWAWCGVPAGVLGAAAIPPGLTTEAHIFTGPTTTTPPPPAPPEDFTVTYKDVFASFVHLTFSYNATFNLTKVTLIYKDPQDSSRHYITLKTVADGGDFDPTSLHEPASGRLGFEFRLGGLYRLRRYNLRADGFRGRTRMAGTTFTFLTGEDDGEDKLYNLQGIFLVLGISTIIMVVVMVCVGYEKLIHEKKDECCRVMCCRRGSKKPPPKSSISPEPLVVRDNRGDLDDNSNPRY